jgi:hypothetical protein
MPPKARNHRPRRLGLAVLLALAVVLVAGQTAASAREEGRRPRRPPRPPASGCLPGFDCRPFTVASCEGVPSISGLLAVSVPAGARGLAVFLGGGGGEQWFGGGTAGVLAWMDRLERDGLGIAQVRWKKNVWAAPESAGPDAAACRSAEALRMVHRDVYLPLGAEGGSGACGFCLVGNSGGASQAAYALSRYGLDELVDVAVLAGGPPHAALDKGCLRRSGEEAYWYEPSNARRIDSSYGFRADGPCARHDSSYHLTWLQDSVDTGSLDYLHGTRIVLLYGAQDPTVGPQHGRDYAMTRGLVPTNQFDERTVPNTGHDMAQSPQGQTAIRAALFDLR